MKHFLVNNFNMKEKAFSIYAQASREKRTFFSNLIDSLSCLRIVGLKLWSHCK